MIAAERRVIFLIINVSPAMHGTISERPSAVFELAKKRSKVAMMTMMIPSALRRPEQHILARKISWITAVITYDRQGIVEYKKNIQDRTECAA